MDSSFMLKLEGWRSELTGVERARLGTCGIGALLELSQLLPRPSLLCAATRFWDGSHHVFRFNMEELCPTIDEFEFLVGMELSGPPVVPLFCHPFGETLQSLCGLSKFICKKLTSDGELDVLGLMGYFRVNRHPGNLTYEQRRLNAFLICFVAGFLLVDGHGKASIRILEVIWLSDQFKLTTTQVIKDYTPIKYLRYAVCDYCTDKGQWFEWLKARESHKIRWRLQNFSEGLMISELFAPGLVMLLGLRASIVYFPGRIQRQFSHAQTFEMLYDVDTVRFPEEWRCYPTTWANRRMFAPGVLILHACDLRLCRRECRPKRRARYRIA
ncbi:hypothetical protein Vadar_012343 [Vaccinium darrowii]|uniref:Uncharacterized protein n=1 Tax=Vaccinium darrowii TaxID=229202 RepID=A0ACB7Z4W6_9ERIC|nr:hypothetical protein Vadar_012343 [Vaccinium darrowii]